MLSNRHNWYLCSAGNEENAPTVIHINADRFVIGRRPGVQLKLISPFISGQHAELTVRGERLFVTDLGSRNGVFINGERVRRGQLGLGDLLTIGDVHFRIRNRPQANRRAGGGGDSTDIAKQHLDWLARQLDRVVHDQAVVPVLTPVVGLQEETIVGYRAMASSNIAGMETESNILQAAQQLGREAIINRGMVTACGSAAQRVGRGRWLCLSVPSAINIESELLPVLQSLRENSPETSIIVAFADLPGRSLRSLNRLAAVFNDLSIDLGLTDFHWKQQQFLQTSELKPAYVWLNNALAISSFRNGNADQIRVRSLADLLHHKEIRLAISNVMAEEQLCACRDLGVDFADGPTVGDSLPLPSQPLPDTHILSSSQVAAMFGDDADVSRTAGADTLQIALRPKTESH